MAVPESSKYLIGAGAANWSEPLAAYYSKRNQQEERHLADSIQQRNKQAQVTQDESFVNVLAKIEQFSGKAAGLKKALDIKRDKEINEINKETATNVALVGEPFMTELNAIRREEYEKKRDGVLTTDAQKVIDNKYAALKKQEGPLKSQAAEALINASGRRLIAANEALAYHAVTGASKSALLKDLKFRKGFADEYAAASEAKDSKKVESLFDEYRTHKLAHLNLKPEVLAGVLGKELQRQKSTFRGITQAGISAAVSTAEQRRVGVFLTTAAASGNFEDAVYRFQKDLKQTAFTKDGEVIERWKPRDGLTTDQLINQHVYNTIDALAKDGIINNSHLSAYLNKGIVHPAGKTIGETIINKEQVNQLVKSATIGDYRKVEAATSIENEKLARARDMAIRGEDNSQLINELRATGIISEQAINDVDRINIYDNTPQAYADEKKDWRGRLTSGNLLDHEERAKTIKNEDFKKEVLARIEHQKERRIELGYPEDDEKFIRDRIAKAFNLTLKEDEKLTGKLYEFQVHLVQKFRKGFQNQIEGPNGEPIIDPNSFTLANADFETYIVNNGINGGRVEGAPEGIFTADGQGRLNNFKIFQKQRLDAIREHQSSARLATSQRLMDKYDRQVWNAYDGVKGQPDNGQPLKERVLDTSESVLSRNDILGFFSTKKLAPEIIYKARRLGIPPSTLIRRQLEALVKADPEYAKLHQLDKIEFPEGGDEQIYGMLERSDPNLRYAFTRADLSPNQNQRLIESWNRALDKKEYDQHLQ